MASTSLCRQELLDRRCRKKWQNVCSILNGRESGEAYPFNQTYRGRIGQRYLPNCFVGAAGNFPSQVFCGQFSADGAVYMSACQDKRIRLYRTEDLKKKKPYKVVDAKNISWSIIDVDFSPDQRMLIYSSWSNFVYMCNVYGEEELHEPLDFNMAPAEIGHRSCCLFSIKFSPDSREIIAGCSDKSIYIYDIEAQKPTHVFHAHDDDVNSVCFASDAPHVFYSASDDCLCKVWDRRLMKNGSPNKPVGALLGHSDGLTHVSSRGDSCYLVTNSKDQSAKLWDVRRMTAEHKVLEQYAQRHSETVDNRWDYRWGIAPRSRERRVDDNDTSVFTFEGHRVQETLIRAYFSPAVTTGQRYVYVGTSQGSSRGSVTKRSDESVFIYDTQTGEIKNVLHGHNRTVRDCAWHPYLPLLVTASFDCTVGMWEYVQGDDDVTKTYEGVKVRNKSGRRLSVRSGVHELVNFTTCE